MAITYADQVAFTNHMIERLEAGLAGRETLECYGRLPTDQYHLGVLAPMQKTGDTLTQPDELARGTLPDADEVSASMAAQLAESPVEKKVGNDQEASPSSIENEEAERRQHEQRAERWGAPSSLGAEFTVVQDIAALVTLTFDVSFAFYTRRFPSWEQVQERLREPDQPQSGITQKTVKISDRHVRHDVSVGPLAIEIDPTLSRDRVSRDNVRNKIQSKIQEKLENEHTELYVWRKLPRMSIPVKVLQSKDSYESYLRQLAEPVDIPPIAAYLDVRTFHLPDGRVRISAYLVNGTPADEISVVGNTTRFLFDARFTCQISGAELSPIEIVSAPQDYQYDPRVWAVGQGCAVEVDVNEQRLSTDGLARYDQPRLVTRNEPEAPFAVLKTDPIPLLYTIGRSMKQYIQDWEHRLEQGQIHLRGEEEQRACQRDLELFQKEVERFHAGITALEADNNLLKSFKAMHRVFERVGVSREITHWRLFQLGFIVTQLPSLAVREGKVDSDTLSFADVLWFPTGGGKTEAYLGLISCALLYDRLRGKRAGVTAWLRFPLRMLSVQQLQRAVKVVYESEQERQQLFGEQADESDPFALGYFVGQSSTPNFVSDAEWNPWRLKTLVEDRQRRDRIRLVRECPQCGEKQVNVRVDADKYRIRHVCDACGHDLQIYVSDDEIYRYLPAVLIGTVDKLPSVAWRKHFAHLWGGVDSRCPEHGYASGRWCIVFRCPHSRIPVDIYDPMPALQIQDELHLLREELGTFAGHYETLASFCQRRDGSLPPKILAATATVEGLDRQSQHLYGLRARRFPSRGYVLGQSFYTQYAAYQNEPEIGRRYLGFRSPVLNSPDAAKQVLEIVHSEIRTLYTLLADRGPEAVILRVGLQDARSYKDVSDILDKYDTTLTYVGSKSHGSRIERALRDEVGRRIGKAGRREIEVSYLNGESTMDDIAHTIDSLEVEQEWDDLEKLDAVIGTSLISHGVDVSRFNLMVMAGMPGRTAEYIQSSSRSGRQYIGIVVVVLSPWMLREQSFYHRFTPYHYHMEHMVEPVPINRFSRYAVDKTMPGVLAGILNAHLAPQYRRDLTLLDEVRKLLWEEVAISQGELLQHVHLAYDLESDLHSKSLRSALEEGVRRRFSLEMRRLNTPSPSKRVADALSRKPMTSLRDVDEQVPFEPREFTYTILPWTSR